jgi:hypothetical protein
LEDKTYYCSFRNWEYPYFHYYCFANNSSDLDKVVERTAVDILAGMAVVDIAAVGRVVVDRVVVHILGTGIAVVGKKCIAVVT